MVGDNKVYVRQIWQVWEEETRTEKGNWRTTRWSFSLNKKLNGFTEQVDRQEQYSKQNCLLIHEINEGNQENTYDLALEIFREKLDIELIQRDLDRTHRIGKNDKRSNQPRPVIVKFIRYND